MNLLWILVAAAVVLVAAALLLRRRETAAQGLAPGPLTEEPTRPKAPDAAAQAPAELLAFEPRRALDMRKEGRQEIFALFQAVPRPPRLLQHLLSPDFLKEASSAQLVDLIAAEPLIAARLLAAVNSPMYGLQRPASGIEQAVMVLGVNTVRAICLQYLLIDAFKPGDGARAQALESTWLASALASEMTQRLAQELRLESSGALVSAVVLSFLGRLAIEANAPEHLLARIPRNDFLARSVAEQQVMGLCASEIGRLLMSEWGVPEPVLTDAADIDGLLTRKPTGSDREARLALCYFCARVGERLADGELAEFQGLDVIDEAPNDFFHLRSYLGHPWLRNLADAARSPALADKLAQMREALLTP